jgi:hypothetical protein
MSTIVHEFGHQLDRRFDTLAPGFEKYYQDSSGYQVTDKGHEPIVGRARNLQNENERFADLFMTAVLSNTGITYAAAQGYKLSEFSKEQQQKFSFISLDKQDSTLYVHDIMWNTEANIGSKTPRELFEDYLFMELK